MFKREDLGKHETKAEAEAFAAELAKASLMFTKTN